VDAARTQAAEWLKSVGKTDAASTAAFEAIWKGNRPLLDKITRTLELGDANVAKLMTEVRDSESPAPSEVPALIKDVKVASYVRANLAVAYAKALLNRKIYDEAIEVLRAVKPEQTADPQLLLHPRGGRVHPDDEEGRRRERPPPARRRGRCSGALPHGGRPDAPGHDDLAGQGPGLDQPQDNVVKDRLEINRGGKKTQKIERDILVRLDEIIKELENQQKGSSSCSGGNCPNGGPSQGGQASGNRPSGPASESALPSGIAAASLIRRKTSS